MTISRSAEGIVMLIRVERHQLGPRVWIGPWRWHHFHSGIVAVAVGVRWIWQDRADLPRFDPEVGLTTTHNKGVW